MWRLFRRSPRSDRFHLDSPARGEIARDRVTVAGWYATPAGMPAERIIVRIGRRAVVCTSCARPDAMAAHPGSVRSPNCGFTISFTTRRGWKWLRIVAVHDGLEHTLARRLLRFDPRTITSLPAALEPSARESAALKSRLKSESAERLRNFFESGARLAFPPASDRPRVSVLMVVWNQAALTLDCIQSLRTAAAGVDCELLVADNGSTDGCPRLWAALDGARVVRNAENLGFLRAVNALAAHARGEYLLLLNNDATLAPDALRLALESAGREPGIGAVGARVILPHGRIQEAGNTILADGSCVGWARGLPPDDVRAQEWKYTDYVSGVFLLTPRAVFEELGGFDEDYAPAYHEDTDYCARLWRTGRRVVCDPRVVVHHHEFASSDSAGSALRQQQTNGKRFVGKHRDWLTGQPALPADATGFRRQAYSGHTLVIDDRVPTPARGAGAPRTLALLEHLAARGRKTVLYPTLPVTAAELEWLARRLGHRVAVHHGPGLAALPAYLGEMLPLFDEVWISRPHNMELANHALESLPADARRPRVIYDAEAIYALRDIGRDALAGRRAPSPKQSRRAVAMEVALAGRVDTVVTVSETEAAVFRELSAPGKDVRVLAHSAGDPVDAPMGFAGRSGWLFIGRMTADNSPNVDSMRWFLGEVFPLIHAASGGEFTLIGDHRCDALSGPSPAGVRFLGAVDDTAGHLARARVFVAPTRFAAGIPLKLVEAAAHGVPSVCTPLLAGQLGWTHEREALVAATPEDFAEACLRLHSDAELWTRIRDGARAHYERNFSPAVFAAQADAILAAQGA